MNRIVASTVVVLILIACGGAPSRPPPMSPADQWQTYCASKANCGLCTSEAKCVWCNVSNKCMLASDTASMTCTAMPVEIPEMCQ